MRSYAKNDAGKYDPTALSGKRLDFQRGDFLDLQYQMLDSAVLDEEEKAECVVKSLRAEISFPLTDFFVQQHPGLDRHSLVGTFLDGYPLECALDELLDYKDTGFWSQNMSLQHPIHKAIEWLRTPALQRVSQSAHPKQFQSTHAADLLKAVPRHPPCPPPIKEEPLPEACASEDSKAAPCPLTATRKYAPSNIPGYPKAPPPGYPKAAASPPTTAKEAPGLNAAGGLLIAAKEEEPESPAEDSVPTTHRMQTGFPATDQSPPLKREPPGMPMTKNTKPKLEPPPEQPDIPTQHHILQGDKHIFENEDGNIVERILENMALKTTTLRNQLAPDIAEINPEHLETYVAASEINVKELKEVVSRLSAQAAKEHDQRLEMWNHNKNSFIRLERDFHAWQASHASLESNYQLQHERGMQWEERAKELDGCLKAQAATCMRWEARAKQFEDEIELLRTDITKFQQDHMQYIYSYVVL